MVTAAEHTETEFLPTLSLLGLELPIRAKLIGIGLWLLRSLRGLALSTSSGISRLLLTAGRTAGLSSRRRGSGVLIGRPLLLLPTGGISGTTTRAGVLIGARPGAAPGTPVAVVLRLALLLQFPQYRLSMSWATVLTPISVLA